MCIGRNQINTQITTVFRHIKLNMFWVCMHGKGNINVLKRISMPPWITITWQGNMLIFNFWLWHKFQSNTKKKVFSKIKCMEQSWQVITYQEFFGKSFLIYYSIWNASIFKLAPIIYVLKHNNVGNVGYHIEILS